MDWTIGEKSELETETVVKTKKKKKKRKKKKEKSQAFSRVLYTTPVMDVVCPSPSRVEPHQPIVKPLEGLVRTLHDDVLDEHGD